MVCPKTPDIVEVMTKWLDGEDYTHRGSGFMGKSWDSFVPGPAVWRECFRVLKPGGHLIAFAGSRTYDLMAIACRMGGFEIRDQGMWLYGSGFPKSLDVSKAIDKNNGEKGRLHAFTKWMRDTELPRSKCADVLLPYVKNKATAVAMAQHYYSDKSQPAIPTPEIWSKLRTFIECEIPSWVDDLVERISAEREVVGKDSRKANESWLGTQKGEKGFGIGSWDLTTPKTPEAQKWTGWGTSLKPAHEPFVIARKPFNGTVADNVLEHGVGGINVDGCRVLDGSETKKSKPSYIANNKNAVYGSGMGGGNWENTSGRFPANLIHDGSEAVEDILGDKARYFYSAKAGKKDRNEGLDEFETKSAAEVTCSKEGQARLNSTRTGAGRTSGSKNTHPTVKPVDLMTYLCRLITPEGGTVLDPFTGSGSTGKAAIREGFNFIGIEMDPEYCEIAKARIKYEINKN